MTVLMRSPGGVYKRVPLDEAQRLAAQGWAPYPGWPKEVRHGETGVVMIRDGVRDGEDDL